MNSLCNRENLFTVNQLLAQNQDLQDKVNSLNDARDFMILKLPAALLCFHVPTQPLSVPSPGGMISRDSCLLPDTRNIVIVRGMEDYFG